MADNWSYKREESSFETNIPEGVHRIRIKNAEKAVSKQGKKMLTLQFEVSGFNSTIYHYIVFLEDRPEITNRNLTAFFDSFKDIPDGEFDTSKWVGKVGAAYIKHEEYNGNTNAKISNFVKAEKQADLPAWKEPEKKSGAASVPTDNAGFVNVPDGIKDELPF